MKMELALKASQDAKVNELCVTVGDVVTAETTLITLESA